MKNMFSLGKRLVRAKLNSHDQFPNSALSSVAIADREERTDYVAATQQNVDGTVTFANDEFIISDPVGQGIYPSIVIPSNLDIQMLIDGRPIAEKSAIVTSINSIQYETRDEAPKVNVLCRISEDRLSVTMRVELINGKRYHIKPFAGMTKAIIQLEEEVLLAEPPSYEELIERLTEGKFFGHIDEQALKELSQTKVNAECIVLRGKPAVSPVPAEFRKVPLPEEYDPFIGQRVSQTVRMGTVVAIVDEGSPGIPGVDVLGKEIEPGCHTNPQLILGTGVKRIDNKVVASRAGRVVVTKRKVDVLPQLVIRHDVSPKDGYVSFDGDIMVYGSILDGSKVYAGGQLKVSGSILGSTVVGEQGVIAQGNFIKSRVTAGWAQQVYKETSPLINRILSDLKRLTGDIKRVFLHMQTKYVSERVKSSVVGAVTTQYYSTLLDDVMKLSNYLKTNRHHKFNNEIEPIDQLIQSKWTDIYIKNLTLEDVQQLFSMLERYQKEIETSISEDVAHIRVSSVTSSTVQCSGNMLITGLGSYSSLVESDQTIEVSGTVRGGFLTAGKSVKIHELGSGAGAETSIRVLDPCGTIDIALRHPNTLIEINGKIDRNLLTEKNVLFRQ